jgi:hypothetical protein
VSVVSQGPAADGLVALTFDDGPGPQTPDILDLFRQHGGHGTFFVLGESVEGREEILARTQSEGHELGNHTFSHPHAMDATDDELAHDIARCQRCWGTRRCCSARPTARTRCAAAASPRRGCCRPRCCGRSTVRLAGTRSQAIATVILDGLAPGAIIDLHDAGHGTRRPRPTARHGGGAAHRAARDGRPRVPVGDRQRLLAAAPIAPG